MSTKTRFEKVAKGNSEMAYWHQNIMAAFLARKLAREKNGRFVKAWLGKRGGNLWQGRERKLSESVEIVESAKIFVLSFSKCEFPVSGSRVVEQVRWSFPLKRAW